MKKSDSLCASHRWLPIVAAVSFCLLATATAAQPLDAQSKATSVAERAETALASNAGPLSPGEHWARINGLQVHYDVVGSGPVLVIQSPSWGIGSDYLLNGLSPLAKHFTLVAYDVAGSGASDKPEDGYSLTSSEVADQLEGLRQHLKLPQMDLLGHSQGSALAMTYASRFPSRVRRLVLVGSQLYGYAGTAETKPLDEARRQDPRFKEAIKAADEPRPPTDEAYTRHFIRMSPYYLYDTKDAPAFIATLKKPLSAWPSQAKRRPAPPVQQVDSLPLITARTLVIDGLQDPVCPPMVSRRISEGIKESTLVIYENTGHFPWIEQPARFFDDVVRHVAGKS
ncbi:alpha/beta fold hydrolase [Roseateles chitinivorans]|uniref:alpha/beta fold hydrolase n=1 Tax=Roseateles chitinivorans TaxID=2917965 RepID=UPI003D667848